MTRLFGQFLGTFDARGLGRATFALPPRGQCRPIAQRTARNPMDRRRARPTTRAAGADLGTLGFRALVRVQSPRHAIGRCASRAAVRESPTLIFVQCVPTTARPALLKTSPSGLKPGTKTIPCR